MPASLDDFIDRAQVANTVEELKHLFAAAIKEEGYENFVLVTAKNRRVDHVTWSEFPVGYLDTYYREKWDRLDPILHFTQHSVVPFQWDHVVQTTTLSKTQHNFLHDCRGLGVHSGLTLPFHSPGNVTDLFSLSLRANEQVNLKRIPYIYGLAGQIWVRKCQLSSIENFSTKAIDLTDRELECLKWAKDGKTNWEIGSILKISERTVEFHISNAMKKLGVNNRMLAVIAAIQHGILAVS